MLINAYKDNQHSIIWDEFVAKCPMATFLHTRKFLSYHAERFIDASLLIFDDEHKLIGLFPAARDPRQNDSILSHPGITYGGLLHTGHVRGQRMIDVLAAINAYYIEQGLHKLKYKAIPYVYHQQPASDDIYALFRMKAVRYRCDLMAVIDLPVRPRPSRRRRSGFKKAIEEIQVIEGREIAKDLWLALEENRQRKDYAPPVHSLDDILLLQERFPENILFIGAMHQDRLVAGLVIFVCGQVMRAQYSASNEVGRQVRALDALFEICIERAQQMGLRFFDFGTSNENDGLYLNESLYRFKTEFGAGGIAQEFYEYSLGAAMDALLSVS